MLPKALTVALVLLISTLACGSKPATPKVSTDVTATIATATAYAQSLKTRTSTPTSTPGPQKMAVGNTGGEGVYIRRTPSLADRIKAWPDGTAMTIVGEQTDPEGRRWKKAEDPDGNEGWIPSEYLEVFVEPSDSKPPSTPKRQARGIDVPLSVGNWVYQIRKIEGAGCLGNVVRTCPQGRFLVITATVGNQSDRTMSLSSWDFELIDIKKRRYAISSDGSSALLGERPEALWLTTEVHPGLSKQIRLIFDVPPDDAQFRLRVQGTIWGNEAEIGFTLNR